MDDKFLELEDIFVLWLPALSVSKGFVPMGQVSEQELRLKMLILWLWLRCDLVLVAAISLLVPSWASLFGEEVERGS